VLVLIEAALLQIVGRFTISAAWIIGNRVCRQTAGWDLWQWFRRRRFRLTFSLRRAKEAA
jgi:hypothetical protein